MAWLATAFCILSPTLIVTESSKIAYIFQQQLLAVVWTSACDPAATPAVEMKKVVSSLPAGWQKARSADFISAVGSLAIVQYGPGPEHVTLHLVARHSGAVKFAPALQLEAQQLHFLTTVKAGLAQAIINAPQQARALENKRARLEDILRVIEEQSRALGLEHQLELARASLRRRTRS